MTEEKKPSDALGAESPHEVKQVTRAVEVTPREPLSKKTKRLFFGGDHKVAINYVFTEVLLPSVRNVIVDSVVKGIEELVYGGVSSNRTRSGYTPYDSRNYRDRGRPTSTRREYTSPSRIRNQSPTSKDRTFVLDSTFEVKKAIEEMEQVISVYDVMSIADLKEILGISSKWYTDNNWGWTNIAFLKTRNTPNGCEITLPPPEPL